MSRKEVVKSLIYIKSKGVIKSDALDYLEFDSDQYPDPEVLNSALNEVYGS